MRIVGMNTSLLVAENTSILKALRQETSDSQSHAFFFGNLGSRDFKNPRRCRHRLRNNRKQGFFLYTMSTAAAAPPPPRTNTKVTKRQDQAMFSSIHTAC